MDCSYTIGLTGLVVMIRDKFNTKGHIEIRVFANSVTKQHMSEKFIDIEIY